MKAKGSVSLVSAVVVAGLLVAGCGGGGSGSSSAVAPSTTAASAAPDGQESNSAEAPSEAQAAATGDIPDNQAFLTFRNPSAGYSIRYPEGWARKGSGNDVTFAEKANVIHITVAKGSPQSREGTKVTSSRQSAPDPVTGKSLPLTVDRYEYGHGGRVAVLDLSTPVGVDNVDAYRLISESFNWLG